MRFNDEDIHNNLLTNIYVDNNNWLNVIIWK